MTLTAPSNAIAKFLIEQYEGESLPWMNDGLLLELHQACWGVSLGHPVDSLIQVCYLPFSDSAKKLFKAISEDDAKEVADWLGVVIDGRPSINETIAEIFEDLSA